MSILPYNKNLKFPSRELREEMTIAENLLWEQIRRKQILSVQFYRQKPIGSYIIDFYSKYPKIAIELDGGYHLERDQRKKDLNRDLYLTSLGIKTLRFTNHQILKTLDSVLQTISKTIQLQLI
jgi:very-short-patch-repair endonuclease